MARATCRGARYGCCRDHVVLAASGCMQRRRGCMTSCVSTFWVLSDKLSIAGSCCSTTYQIISVPVYPEARAVLTSELLYLQG